MYPDVFAGAVEWLLGQFSSDITTSRALYREWVEDGIAELKPALEHPSLGTILRRPTRASGASLHRARSAGFSVRQIANHLGADERTVRRWIATTR